MEKLGFLILLFNVIQCQKNPHFSENRDTIVHLFEWKWLDIAAECENFLQYKGFAGVQISPPTENRVVDGRPWWERYQPISYKIITRSGNEAEFLQMTTRCNAVGVRIYADVILNHMAANGENVVGTGGTKAYPGNRLYPGVPYTSSHFHQSCALNDFTNAYELRNCELVGLPDLNQTEPYVRTKLLEFLNHLVDLGVAGFRFDAAKHMWPSDLKFIYENIKNLNTSFGFIPYSKPYIVQEVIDKDGSGVTRDEYLPLGVITEFKYGLYLGRVFDKQDKLRYLINWGPEWSLVSESSGALVFIDNHDTEREDEGALTYKNAKLYKMAIAFMLAHPYGVPRFLSGFAFHDFKEGPPHHPSGATLSPVFSGDICVNGWTCTHRWRQIYNSVVFRNVVKDTQVTNFWFNPDHGQQISFCRGNKGFVAMTNEGNLQRMLQTCLPRGIYCDVISGNLKDGRCTGKMVSVGPHGYAQINISENEEDGVLLLHIESRLRSKL